MTIDTSALTAGLVMGIMIIPFVSSLSDDIINRASEGEVVLFSSENEDRVRAVVELDRFIGA